MRLTLQDVMSAIYDAEENCSVGSDWDGGWRVRVGIGGSQHTAFLEEAYVDTLQDATEWLHERALLHFPDYAKRFGVTVTRTGKGNPPGQSGYQNPR